jgi:hypothetical protein
MVKCEMLFMKITATFMCPIKRSKMTLSSPKIVIEIRDSFAAFHFQQFNFFKDLQRDLPIPFAYAEIRFLFCPVRPVDWCFCC